MPWPLASSLPSQNPSLHNFQRGDRLQVEAHLTYQSFSRAVEELVEYWGSDREFEPGWTPRELAEDITRRFTDELWNRQDDPFQTRVLELLNVRSASYDIYSPNFVRYHTRFASVRHYSDLFPSPLHSPASSFLPPKACVEEATKQSVRHGSGRKW